MPKAGRVLSTPRLTAPQFLIDVNRLQLSLLIHDAFVRSAFDRAERDGLAPMAATVDRPCDRDGGAVATLELAEG